VESTQAHGTLVLECIRTKTQDATSAHKTTHTRRLHPTRAPHLCARVGSEPRSNRCAQSTMSPCSARSSIGYLRSEPAAHRTSTTHPLHTRLWFRVYGL